MNDIEPFGSSYYDMKWNMGEPMTEAETIAWYIADTGVRPECMTVFKERNKYGGYIRKASMIKDALREIGKWRSSKAVL